MLLDTEADYDFEVIAICSSEPEYSMAFHINQHLGLSLKLRSHDLLDYDSKLKKPFKYVVYDAEMLDKGVQFILLANKSWEDYTAEVSGFGDLFSEAAVDTSALLFPHQKKVDYFLLVYDCDHRKLFDDTLKKLKEIPQIITSYLLDLEGLKSKEKLLDIRDSYE